MTEVFSPQPTASESTRQVNASVLRAFGKTLKAMGKYELVLEQTAGVARELLQDPPLFGWLDFSPFDRLCEQTLAVIGEDDYLALTYRMVKISMGPILEPLLKTVVTLGGATPASIFRKLHTINQMSMRGPVTEYHPDGPTSGKVVVSQTVPFLPAAVIGWRGSLLYTFDFCEVKGSVSPAQVEDAGRVLRYAVSWSE